MKIQQITQYLDQVAPPSYQESYDNAGLLVGDANAELTGVLVCLDCLESIVEEAKTRGCNLIVAHHPIVFGGLKRFTGKNYVERVIIKAIQYNIVIYAAHTNLDNVFVNGVNGKIAQKLGLTNTQILQPKTGLLKKLATYVPQKDAENLRNALFAAGAGNIGNYSECSFNLQGIGTFNGNEASNPTIGERGQRHHEAEEKVEVIFLAHQENQVLKGLFSAHPYEEVAYEIFKLDNSYKLVGAGIVGDLAAPMDSKEFLYYLKKTMQTDCVRYTNIHKPTVQRIAICGGAGSFLLRDAMRAKADVFITGDYKYHQFFDAENQLIIADIGHYESEQFTIELFQELLTQQFSEANVQTTNINTNPIAYL